MRPDFFRSGPHPSTGKFLGPSVSPYRRTTLPGSGPDPTTCGPKIREKSVIERSTTTHSVKGKDLESQGKGGRGHYTSPT